MVVIFGEKLDREIAFVVAIMDTNRTSNAGRGGNRIVSIMTLMKISILCSRMEEPDARCQTGTIEGCLAW